MKTNPKEPLLVTETLLEKPPNRPPFWWPLIVLYGFFILAFGLLLIVITILLFIGALALLVKGVGVIGAWVVMG